MPERAPEKPTGAELEILQVLWGKGPCTVRDVHDALGPARGVGYTTILKLMQRMAERGLVTRDESQRTHVYAAGLSQERTQTQLVRDLLARAFGGSAQALVMKALAAGAVTGDELREIRRLLDQMEGDSK
jgi:BlaI family transcriptional regulator, penicillinase repressor